MLLNKPNDVNYICFEALHLLDVWDNSKERAGVRSQVNAVGRTLIKDNEGKLIPRKECTSKTFSFMNPKLSKQHLKQ